uniref:Integrase core domain containing protein n=1 Tax=Solanum tuberosum TaxID=4113 RepID=M1DEY7_SOLTU
MRNSLEHYFQTEISLSAITQEEMLMRARKEQTSLPFPILITQLCEDARVPFWERTDVWITPTHSNDIRRTEADYLRDDAAWRKPPPSDTTPMVYPTTLKTNVAPSVEPSCTTQPSIIPSTSKTVAPVPSS